MSSSPDQRVTALKIAGWLLRIAAVIVLAALLYQLAEFLLTFPQIASYSSFAVDVSQLIPLILGTGLLQWGSGRFFDQARAAESELEEKVIGYVTSNQSVSIATVSGWVGMPQKKTADLIARLSAKGRLRGYVIDLPSQAVFSPPSSQPTTGGPFHIPNMVTAPPPPDLSDEVVKIKAKLYELDTLKKQGRISEQEYNEMREDLERKLVNVDSGTQVY